MKEILLSIKACVRIPKKKREFGERGQLGEIGEEERMPVCPPKCPT
jgi:hypothetical protein